MAAQHTETLHTWDTEYSADSVEWCPVAPFHHIFVCGTYQLIENTSNSGEQPNSKTQKKIGRLYLFNMDPLADLIHLQSLDMPAILDTKWCHQRVQEKVLLGIANAAGDLLLYELHTEKDLQPSDGGSAYQLILLSKTNISNNEDEGPLALSLDWSTGKFGNDPNIAVSDSHGGVSLFKLMGTSLQAVRSWKSHKFESWITAFNYWNPSIIYSGGDDCKLYVYDSRLDTPIVSNTAHEMGVTSMHCNAEQENLLISGSYDEKLCVWDTRSMKQPMNKTSLIGGIWRLKWEPHQWNHILAACMYGGFCVVNYTKSAGSPEIVTEYKEHGSLAYGSDWCHLSHTEVKAMLHEKLMCFEEGCADYLTLIATCSFYDHKLCITALNNSFTTK